MEKKKLRADVKSRLAMISQNDKESLDKDLSRILFDSLHEYSLQKDHKLIIGAFDPIQVEPVWFKAWNVFDAFKFSFPGNLNDNSMSFYSKENWDFKNLNIGIGLESLTDAKEVVPDVLVIPGLAFTKDGCRLGRGKGFYDRYLTNFTGLKIGVCFECQIYDQLPTNEHDQRLDWLITEKNIYKGRH